MKYPKILLLLPVLAATVLLCSCKKDDFVMPSSNWILSGTTGNNGYLLKLKFDGANTMLVQEAEEDQYPFCENPNDDQLWNCEVEVDDGDTILHISYTETHYDSDGNYQITPYNFSLPMSLSLDDRSLTLTYERFRLFHKNDILCYHFIRR